MFECDRCGKTVYKECDNYFCVWTLKSGEINSGHFCDSCIKYIGKEVIKNGGTFKDLRTEENDSTRNLLQKCKIVDLPSVELLSSSQRYPETGGKIETDMYRMTDKALHDQ